jgi:hypothetical protein
VQVQVQVQVQVRVRVRVLESLLVPEPRLLSN